MTRITAVLIAFLLCGCAAVQDFGTRLKYNVQGEYYLQEKQYISGLQMFEQVVKDDPYNAEANYYYGRFLLADDKAKESLPYLERAVGLNPGKSDYHFWLGGAYGETGQEDLERKSYGQAIRLDSTNAKALTSMGNSLLGTEQYTEALDYYQKSLELNQSDPQALYNRAVILGKLQRVPEEKLALLLYLDSHPTGSFARRAADRLNSLDEHSYRNYSLGARTITLAEIRFKPFSAELTRQSLPSLDVLGTTLTHMTQGSLNILVYQLNNQELAKKRALSIANYLSEKYPQLKKYNRIRVSWFDVAEKRNVLKKQVYLNQSVDFFLTDT